MMSIEEQISNRVTSIEEEIKAMKDRAVKKQELEQKVKEEVIKELKTKTEGQMASGSSRQKKPRNTTMTNCGKHHCRNERER